MKINVSPSAENDHCNRDTGSVRSMLFSENGGKSGVVLGSLSFIVYLVFFAFLARYTGNVSSSPIAAVIPVIVIGWYYGAIAGISVALVSIVVNLGLFAALGFDGWNRLIMQGTGFVGTAALAMIGAIVGRVSDLRRRLKRELRERRAAERESKEARDFLEEVFRTSADGIMVSNATGEIIRVNTAVCDMTGYSADELTCMRTADLVYPEEKNVQSGTVLIELLLSRGSVNSRDLLWKHKDGSALSVELNITTIKDADNKITSAVAAIRNITDRKQAAAELREQTERLNRIIDSSIDCIIVADILGNILKANNAYLEMIGYTEEEFIGRHTGELSPREPGRYETVTGETIDLDESFFEESRRMIETLFELGKVSRFEGYVQRKDGKLIRTEENIVLAYDSSGAAREAIGTIRDITRRKQMEDELRQARDQLDNIIESSLDSIVITDRCGNIVRVNRAFADMVGYLPEELQGKSTVELAASPGETYACTTGKLILIDASYVDDIGRMVECLFETGKISNWESYYLHKDNTLVPIDQNSVLLRDDSGEIVGSVGVIRDITERRRVFEELRDAKDSLEQLIENSIDPIIVSDSSGCVKKANRAFLEMGGYEEADLIGEHVMVFSVQAAGEYESVTGETIQLTDETFQESADWIARLFAEGKVVNWKSWFVNKAGRIIPVMNNIVVLYNDDGEPTGTFGIIRDITEQRIAERALVQAKEEAEAASIAKSQFLANMSHEVRTPMNGVLGMTGLLLDTWLTSKQRTCAETIQKSANALLEIINDILDFSKIEACKLTLENIGFDLRTTLEDMGEPLAYRSQQDGIEYACLIDHDVPSLLQGDPGRVRQILINLITNAIKFTSEGEVALHVHLVDETEQQARLCFEVIDTGIGIPGDRVDNLFQEFTQLDASITRQYGGTGLGLAISSRLSELMGGTLQVESVPGKGTTFYFELLFEKQKAIYSDAAYGMSDLAGMPILIVDDNATNRLVLAEQLKSWQCRFDEAPDGDTALRKLREAVRADDPFKIAVLDKAMPAMDGQTLGEKIKADSLLCDTLLVMMTSIGEPGDAAVLAEIGFDAYLIKPVRHGHLLDCLTTVLGRNEAGVAEAGRGIVTRHTLVEEHKQKIRILLAEDNETNQMVALGILEKFGFRADAVANGVELLDAIARKHYDLILMDVQMPEMDGLEATRKIRSQEQSLSTQDSALRIPVIAMTAHAMKGDRQRCLDAGMDDYISKPVDPEELLRVIEKYLFARKSEYKAAAAAEAQVTENHVFDYEELLNRLCNDRNLLKKVVAIFIQKVPTRIANLHEALERNDTGALHLIGHGIKGAAATAGAGAMQETAFNIEVAAKENDFMHLGELIAELEEEYVKLKQVADEKLEL
ncbi:MAG: PAS domain S-box protein [Deltaproteobacteria bacterium]|nr:PAS domain S-box protein [Deltaproteobacteria bacterium]